MRVNKFIVIDNQKDLPTESEMLDNLHCTTKLEEFIMPNGDVIVACEDIKLNAPDMPVNLKATEMYYREAIHGHCYLIKKDVRF